jgi:xanthine dehydrogenase accessory factor
MLEVLQEAVKAIKQGKNFAFATIITSEGSTPRHENSKMIIFEDGTFKGTIGGGLFEKRVIEKALELIRKGKSMVVKFSFDSRNNMLCGGEVEVFIEVYLKRPELVLVGGGHVSNAIYNFAKFLDFNITVIDDREEWVSEDRFPEAKRIVDNIPKALESYPTDENTFIVIATRGHVFDKQALEVALSKKAQYIGMLGSKDKVRSILQGLREKGFKEEELKRVYSPIGLDLGGESPEEIAVSILAEILKIKNKRSGESLRISVF